MNDVKEFFVKTTEYAILGAGALGSALAYVLQSTGHSYRFIGRFGYINKTFKIEISSSNISLGGCVLLQPTESLEGDYADLKVVFVTTKSYDLKSAFEINLAKFSKGTVIVVLCNGYIDSIIEEYAAKFRDLVFRRGISTVGVTSVGERSYKINSTVGDIVWGDFAAKSVLRQSVEVEEEKNIFLKFCDPKINVRWVKDAKELACVKWLYNTVINTTSAYFNLSCNGQLLEMNAEVTKVFDEAYALGGELFSGFKQPKSDLYMGLIRLIENTRDNVNSMLADLQFKRQTESDYLAGWCMNFDKDRFALLRKMHMDIISR